MPKSLRTVGSITIFILFLAIAHEIGERKVFEVNATEYIIAGLLAMVAIVKFLEWTEPPKKALRSAPTDDTTTG